MLVSAAQQSESAIYIYIHTYPSLLSLPPMPTHAVQLGRSQVPTEVPALYRGFPLAVFHARQCTHIASQPSNSHCSGAPYRKLRASWVTQLVKNPPAIQETPVRFLGGEVPPTKG